MMLRDRSSPIPTTVCIRVMQEVAVPTWRQRKGESRWDADAWRQRDCNGRGRRGGCRRLSRGTQIGPPVRRLRGGRLQQQAKDCIMSVTGEQLCLQHC